MRAKVITICMLPLPISLNQRTILGITRAKQIDKDPFGKTLASKESHADTFDII